MDLAESNAREYQKGTLSKQLKTVSEQQERSFEQLRSTSEQLERTFEQLRNVSK